MGVEPTRASSAPPHTGFEDRGRHRTTTTPTRILQHPTPPSSWWYNGPVSAVVRPYVPGDREAVFRIAADTAYFGDPVEQFLPDRQFLLDVFVSYYLDCEPDHTWVADVDGEVAGYLTGSTGGAAAAAGQLRTGLRASARLMGGRYRLGAVGRGHLRCTVLAKVRGEYPSVDERAYPAHLHVNLAPAARGLSLGRRLVEACLGQMAQLGVPGLHLNTTNLNAAAVRLYEKMGFELLARSRTRLWEPHMPGVEVFHLAYGRRITEADLSYVSAWAPAPADGTLGGAT